GTTTGNLVVNTNAPPGCTGTAGANPCSVTVYVRGEWHWLSHTTDCNTDRAGSGVGLVWKDANEPGYTVSNGHGLTEGVGVKQILNADPYNTIDEMVHPTDLGNVPENLAGLGGQTFNDPSPPNPNSYKSWRSGCGREPLSQTSGSGPGTSTGCGETPPSQDCKGHPWGSWGYFKTNAGSDGDTYFGY